MYVRIGGPEMVPLGETVEFTLTAQMSDGSTRDVTAEANWTTDYPQLAIEAPGRIRGHQNGDAWITATHERETRSMRVFVVPSGTFRLTGAVFEADSPTGPVVGAAVEVRRGRGSGQVVLTDVEGTFRLFGVAGPVTLRVFKAGYETVEESIVVDDHEQSVQTTLTLQAPRTAVSGPYTVTIRASKRCGVGMGEGNLPEEFRVRTYTATVRQEGPKLSVELSGARFSPGGSGFTGRVEPTRIVFDLPWDGWSSPPAIEEWLGSGRFFMVYGTAFVTGSSDHLSGRLAANMTLADRSTSDLALSAMCDAADHEFTLSR